MYLIFITKMLNLIYLVEGTFLYAYKNQVQYQTLRVVPSKKNVTNPHAKKIVRKQPVKRRKNVFAEFFRTVVILSFLSVFGVFVSPNVYNAVIAPVFNPNKIQIDSTYKNNFDLKLVNQVTAVDIYSISHPVTNYIHNDLFNNRLLLTPVVQKDHNEVTTMYHSNEMLDLKKALMNLFAGYPTIKPSVYVWEYDNGQYVDINSEKLYSAASIIKLPVLVRLFKSIEANQLTIYDEMTLSDLYRSEGSGNLQYAPSGMSYQMDYLAKTMIQDSDNTSTNMIMSKLGGMEDINIGLRDWGISKTYVRTWLPDMKGTNKTTAFDIAKILYNLDNPGFLNINSREYIIDYMSHVKNDRLIQQGLGEGALFIHKTGDIGSMLGDAGIVYAPNGKKYIVVILAERPYNSPLGKELIVKASNIIYNAVVK